MNQLEIIAVIFSVLFLAQTAVFSYLLMRARRKMEQPVVLGKIGWPEPGSCDLTETEIKIIELIESKGPQSARDLSKALGLSREHVARILKRLVESGLLTREGKPYRYKLTELGRGSLRSRDIARSGESS